MRSAAWARPARPGAASAGGASPPGNAALHPDRNGVSRHRSFHLLLPMIALEICASSRVRHRRVGAVVGAIAQKGIQQAAVSAVVGGTEPRDRLGIFPGAAR